MKRSVNYFSKMLGMLLLFAGLVVSSCYDDSALQEQLKDHESRLEELERLVTQQNTNISSLQTIVQALLENDYVTNVAPIKEGDEVVGYTITFSKSGSVTIYNGEDGYDPVIGVRQAADNLWYWTVDGEWLLDSNGDKVRASAADGKDGLDGEDGKNGEDGKDGEQGPAGQPGVTPLLKIVDGYWYVSYDGGKTWEDEPLGQATGDKCCTMFADVTYDEDYLYLTMADGTVISLPVAETALTIVPESDVVIVNSQKHTFEIEVKGAAEGVEIDYILEDDSWTVTCTMTSDSKYLFDISAPSVSSSTKMVIFASSDNGFAMHKVTLTRERELMLSLNNADYDSYSFHITVPETVSGSNNHVRFHALTLPQYNQWKITEGKYDDDLIKWMLSDSRQNCYRAEYVTEDNDINISHENEGYYSNCYPGCPMVAFACEFTPDGQPVGNSAMLEFKLKEPSRLNASVEVEVSDIKSYDAEITIAPTNLSVRQCKMYILTDEDYGKYLDYLGGAEELLPWSVYSQNIEPYVPVLYFEKEYAVVYDLDVTRISLSSLTNAPSYIKPDTKYHILATGMSLDDCVVRSVTFTHETFTTGKNIGVDYSCSVCSATYAELKIVMDEEYKVGYHCLLKMDENNDNLHSGRYYMEGSDSDKRELVESLYEFGWRTTNQEGDNKEAFWRLSPDTEYVIAYIAKTFEGELSDLCFSEPFRTKRLTWGSDNHTDIALKISEVTESSFRMEFTYNPSNTAVVKFIMIDPENEDLFRSSNSTLSQDDLHYFWENYNYDFINEWEKVDTGSDGYTSVGWRIPEVVVLYCAEDLNGVMSHIKVTRVHLEQ